jgi:hypothetical protein
VSMKWLTRARVQRGPLRGALLERYRGSRHGCETES